MKKNGRNDPCISGKKYKNCCLGEPEEAILWKRLRTNLANMWSYDKVNNMSDTEVIAKLEDLNIPFDKEQFLEDMKSFDSANDLSEQWFETYDVHADGYAEDFPFFTAWLLWERWSEGGPWPLETIGDWFNKACLRWRKETATRHAMLG